tara:strand:+ start:623 stop:1399 length:777 start_codon:yes stop_codon:yes gene_type:complete
MEEDHAELTFNENLNQAIIAEHDIPIIGIKSRNNKIRNMITEMKRVADGENEPILEYTLNGFIKNFKNGFKPDAIEREIDGSRIPGSMPPYFHNNPPIYYTVNAQKIYRQLNSETHIGNYFTPETIQYMNQAGIIPNWDGYMRILKNSVIILHLIGEDNYEFRITIPNNLVPNTFNTLIRLSAYDYHDFLHGLKQHIFNVAEEHYNPDDRTIHQLIENPLPGGKKSKTKRSKKKSVKKGRKTKAKSSKRRRKTKKKRN